VKPSDSPVTFVVPGDLHLTKAGRENHRVALWAIEEISDLIRPDFVQFIGDNVQDATEDQFRLFDDLRARLAVPHHALVGDHDVKDDPEARGFHAHVGETFGRCSLRRFRFIRLNTQQARPLGLSPEQVNWFRDEVDSARATGYRVIIFQHNYPYQIWEDFAGPGIDEWRAIVQTRRIEAIICGHTHYGQVANDGRNVVVATRSIGDPEGGPPDYTICHAHGDDLATTYRSVEDSGPVVLVTHPRDKLLATGPRHIVAGPDRTVARTWSSSVIEAVHCRVDGGAWTSMTASEDGRWSAPLQGDRLDKGEHIAEVMAIARDGSTGSQRLEFMVDPTARFTAVPCVRPLVSKTAFC
jgi:hypothetical protein